MRSAQIKKNNYGWGTPWVPQWLRVRNSWNDCWIPGQETKISHAAEQLLSLCTQETELHI